MKLKFGLPLNCKNVNGIKYDKKSFLKALEAYVAKDGKIYSKMYEGIKTKKKDLIGKILYFEIKDNIIFADCAIVSGYTKKPKLHTSTSGVLDLKKKKATIDSIEYVHTDDVFDSNTKKYYRTVIMQKKDVKK